MSKRDISNVATKKDIDKLEDSLKKFATKSELKSVEKNLRQEILRVEEKVENVEERLEGVEEKVSIIDSKLDKIQNTLDKFVGVVDDLRTDNVVGANQTRELQIQVDNHEKRITKLESI